MMTPEDVYRMAAEIQHKAVEEAHRAQLAFATGNYPEYLHERFTAAKQRLDEAYEDASQPDESDDELSAGG